MKIRFIITAFLLIVSANSFSQTDPVSVSQSTGTITIQFTLPAYSLKDTIPTSFGINEIFKLIELNDHFGTIDDAGYPQLPQYTCDLHAPGAISFSVTVSGQVTEQITLNRRIYPTQEDFGLTGIPSFQLNQAYYDSNGSLYNDTYQLSEPYIVFGEQGVSMTIFPFRYNPQAGTITVLKQATFTVDYVRRQQTSVPQDTESTNEYLSNYFKNYPTSSSPTRLSSSSEKTGSRFGGRYLMITSPDLEATLAPFAAYKRNLSYVVTVVTTNTTGPTNTDIKSHIQGRYNNRDTRPDFILLVGDIGRIPASGGSTNADDEDNPLTDLHYALLAGDDYEADVFLGRWPVNSIQELQNIINKTVFMEMNIPHFEKKALLVAGQHGTTGSLEEYVFESYFDRGHRHAIRNGFSNAGYQSQKLKQPNLNTVTNALNNNPLFFAYSGHGNTTSIAGRSFYFDSTQFTVLTNNVFPFMFSFACQTGNFAGSIGNDWVNFPGGGVSYFGSAVNTTLNSDVAIESKIFGDAFTDEEQLGSIIRLGMRRYKIRFWSKLNQGRTRRNLKAYNLLGDPSLNIWGRDNMLSIPAVCPSARVDLHNLTNIPVEWSVTGNFSLSDETNTTVVVTRTGAGTDVGTISARFVGCGTVTREIEACSSPYISGPDVITACGGNVTYVMNPSVDVTWEVNGLEKVSETSTSVTVRYNVSSYYPSIQANYPGGNTTKSLSRSGIPSITCSGDIRCSDVTYGVAGGSGVAAWHVGANLQTIAEAPDHSWITVRTSAPSVESTIRADVYCNNTTISVLENVSATMPFITTSHKPDDYADYLQCVGNTSVYFHPNGRTASNIRWTVPSYLRIVSGQNTDQIVVAYNSLNPPNQLTGAWHNGEGYIRVDFNDDCGASSAQLGIIPWTGAYPELYGIGTYDDEICPGSVTFYVEDDNINYNPNMKYAWYLNGNYIQTTTSGYLTRSFGYPQDFSLYVIPWFTCGHMGPTAGGGFSVSDCSDYYCAYPNPASNILNIEFNNEPYQLFKASEQKTTDAKQLKQEKTYDIRLYDNQGTLLRHKKTKGGSVQFNVANLPNGIYYLHIYDGVNEKPEMRQIVVEH